ncbi:MAG TPA: carboxypeptidase-like regulatory domain-containing protein [Pyrinomonadaceae bacterium]|nr:carboxypeptidase-like regulatory domain-containing protein [Pyrinomonadaceae bacterium]
MSRLACFALLLIAGVACAVFSVVAESQTKAPKKAATSIVSGRVTIHGKAAPGIVVGIHSQAFSMPPAPMLKATTDQEGNYRITGIPAGNYQVTPEAAAYVLPNSPGPRMNGKTLILAEGEDVSNIDFSLMRGGVITGKVTDADGRPVIEERIIILSELQTRERGQPPILSNQFQTDDRGIYRLYGIPAGRYKIAVGLADDGSPNQRFGRVAYKRAFYPNATAFEDAEVVEVSEGTEVTGVNITVGRNLPGFAVTGKVIDGETGQPLGGLRFALRAMATDGYSVTGGAAVSNTQGEFRMENITPGKYSVMLVPQLGSEVIADSVPFEVVDQDVMGLLIQTTKGASITGTVVVEGGTNDKSLASKLERLRVSVYVRSENSNMGFGRNSTINADGSFHISGISAGTANFYLSQQDRSLLSTFSILRLERDGIALPRQIEIKSGENVTGVRLVLSYSTGSIRGTINVENGPLPQGANLVVSIRKLEDTGSGYRTYRVDARGRFLIEGLAAGNYELYVTVNAAGRRSSPTKQLINVSEGAVINVDVTVDLKSSLEP